MEDAADKAYLVDKMFIQGISHNRTKNDWNVDYIVQKELEPKGLRTYLHKYHLGYNAYYYKRDFEKEMEKLRDPSLTEEEKYTQGLHWRNQVNVQRKQMVDNRF